jgi:hypothetical protein
MRSLRIYVMCPTLCKSQTEGTVLNISELLNFHNNGSHLTLLLKLGGNTAFLFYSIAMWRMRRLLAFLGASSNPLCYILFPATILHQLFFHPPSLHIAIYFLVYLLVLFPNSYTILFWEFYFLPFSVHVQTNVVYAPLNQINLSLNLSLNLTLRIGSWQL